MDLDFPSCIVYFGTNRKENFVCILFSSIPKTMQSIVLLVGHRTVLFNQSCRLALVSWGHFAF